MAVSFHQSILDNSLKMLRRVDDAYVKISWELFQSVIANTPVLTGALINNWFPSDGNPSTSITYATDQNGMGSLSRTRQFLTQTRQPGTPFHVTLTNNLPYAYRAEMLGWPKEENGEKTPWSGRVGPYRMVAKSLAAVAARYK